MRGQTAGPNGKRRGEWARWTEKEKRMWRSGSIWAADWPREGKKKERKRKRDCAEREKRRKDGPAQGKEKKGKRREGEAWADLKSSKNWAGSKEKEEGKRRKWPAGLGS